MLLSEEPTPLVLSAKSREKVMWRIELELMLAESRGRHAGALRASAEIVIARMENKFDSVPQRLQSRIRKLGEGTLKGLAVALLTLERIKDVREWIDANEGLELTFSEIKRNLGLQ